MLLICSIFGVCWIIFFFLLCGFGSCLFVFMGGGCWMKAVEWEDLSVGGGIRAKLLQCLNIIAK